MRNDFSAEERSWLGLMDAGKAEPSRKVIETTYREVNGVYTSKFVFETRNPSRWGSDHFDSRVWVYKMEIWE